MRESWIAQCTLLSYSMNRDMASSLSTQLTLPEARSPLKPLARTVAPMPAKSVAQRIGWLTVPSGLVLRRSDLQQATRRRHRFTDEYQVGYDIQLRSSRLAATLADNHVRVR